MMDSGDHGCKTRFPRPSTPRVVATRNYYRCTNSKCTMKKRVDRSSADPTTVITTYEGQHCHHPIGFLRGLMSHHEGGYMRLLEPLKLWQSIFMP
ncbi:putative transcription factor WRKY family [Helianthus debilis subsp. tardiflorus]